MAAAPPDMSAELRQTAQAKADAWREHADAQVRADQAAADAARAQAEQHAAAEADLERQHAGYEKWSTATAQTRELGGKAQAELDRRGYADLDRLAEIDELEEERRASIDHVNNTPDAELESAIPDGGVGAGPAAAGGAHRRRSRGAGSAGGGGRPGARGRGGPVGAD